jgi:UDP-3-O-[3-hydroxymyristoyl] glucosamine N-acyltransferase
MTSNQSISKDAIISPTARIWDFSQIRENARIGANSIIGSYVYIDVNVLIGDNCKVQNRALIYDPSIIHDGVFIGPGAILTNDKNPRAIQKSGGIKQSSDWEKVGVEVFEGASIGSGAICIAPVKIGKWALVGAGAVVTARGGGVGATVFTVVAGAAVGAGATSEPEAGATPVRGSGRAPAELATKDRIAPPRRGSMTGMGINR